jgi:hypothetical protein
MKYIQTVARVAINDAIAPAIQLDRGVRKPAIMGGSRGMGKKMNWLIAVSTGSVAGAPLANWMPLNVAATTHTTSTGQTAFEPKINVRIFRMSSM